ncbi:MAG: hypothetical protein ACREQZ_13985 [Woeseiaceae bacterium]
MFFLYTSRGRYRFRPGWASRSSSALRADGRGFNGILERAPREGERLFVGYADGELEPTEVVFRGGSPAPRVA